MRFFKVLFYIAGIIVLQRVVFARLTFLGAIPDLVLVSVIVFTVLNEYKKALGFSAAAGFLQDILSGGIYINTISKVVASTVISAVREHLVGDRYVLTFGLVAVFTPLTLLLEAGILYFFFERQIIFYHFLKTMLLTTIYNVILVPVIYPALVKLCHER